MIRIRASRSPLGDQLGTFSAANLKMGIILPTFIRLLSLFNGIMVVKCITQGLTVSTYENIIAIIINYYFTRQNMGKK